MRTFRMPRMASHPRLALHSVALASIVGAGLLCTSVVVAEDPAPVAPAPAAPTQEQILAWVAQLGSDDFRQREEASAKLIQAGEAAREALETAVKTSDSLEVRWRAQQALLRLDGRKEKRLGAREPKSPGQPGAGQPVPFGTPPSMEELRKLFEADQPEQVKELMERLLRGMGPGSPWSQGQIAPLFGDMDVWGGTVRSGDLTLRTSPFAGGIEAAGQVTLEVRGKDAAGMPTRATYHGASLEAILEANPTLKDHPSLPGLQAEVERWKARRQATKRMPMFSMATSQGVEIRQDASGVTVVLRERGDDGRIATRELKGATLEDIKREHPEVAEQLKGIAFGFSAPQVFRGPRGDRLPPPMPAPSPAPERVLPRDDEPRFGLALEPLEGLLARHLRLEGRGAVLVQHVVPGSQAAAMGVEELDILLSIDGTPLASMEDAIARLRAAAKANGPLALEILRGGKAEVLRR